MTLAALTLLFSLNTKAFNLPSDLLASICFIESSYKIDAIHHDDGGGDSLGICQIKITTARWLGFKGTRQQLMKPEINIYYASKYLAKNLKRYNNNVSKAVIAYNMGSAKQFTSTKYSIKVFKHLRSINFEAYYTSN